MKKFKPLRVKLVDGGLETDLPADQSRIQPDRSVRRWTGTRWVGLLMGTIALSLLVSVPWARATVMRGNQSNAVAQVQFALQQKGFYQGTVHGNFDEQTEAAVKRFQQSKGLPSDGIVGLETAAHLGLSGAEYQPNAQSPDATTLVQGVLLILGWLSSALQEGLQELERDPSAIPYDDRFPPTPAPQAQNSPALPSPTPPLQLSTPTPRPIQRVIVAANGMGLTARYGPGLNYAIAGTYPDGTFLQITGATHDGWVQLTTQVWVPGDWIVSADTAIAPPGNWEGAGGAGGGAGYPPAVIPNRTPAPTPYLQMNPGYSSTSPINPSAVVDLHCQGSPSPQKLLTDGSTPAVAQGHTITCSGVTPVARQGTQTVIVTTGGQDLNARCGPGEEFAIGDIYPNGRVLAATGAVVQGWMELDNGLWVAGNFVR